MGDLNKVLLIGRLGQDPELRTTPAGHSVVSTSLATTEYFKDQGGQKQERTEWHRLVLWNRQAELIAEFCRKGSLLFVEGSLQTREWQDKDGNRRFTTEIVVRNLQFLDSQGSKAGKNAGAAEVQKRPSDETIDYYEKPPGNSGKTGYIEDDVPF